MFAVKKNNRQMKLTTQTGKTLGKIEITTDGKHRLTNAKGKFLGEYDPVRDQTTNTVGKLVGGGNWLSALLALSAKRRKTKPLRGIRESR